MATKKSTQASSKSEAVKSKSEPQPGVLDELRRTVGFEAADQLGAMLVVLRRAANADSTDLHQLVRAMSSHGEQLISVLLSILGKDDGRETSEMAQIVFGDYMPQMATAEGAA